MTYEAKPNTGWNMNLREPWLVVGSDGVVIRGCVSKPEAEFFATMHTNLDILRHINKALDPNAAARS